MLKGLGIVAGSLALLVVVVLTIGALLPRAHVATSTATLRQPADTVWAVIRDLGGVTDWFSQIAKAEPVTDSAGRETWRYETGDGYVMPVVVVDDQPPRRLETEIAGSDNAAFGGRWIYLLEPVGGDTRVTITEDGWIANPFFRFMTTVFFGLHGTIDRYLEDLGRHFGEEVTPIHQGGE